MPQAVRAYQKLKQYHANQNESGQVSVSDYVFVPDYPSRDHALQLLQHQFEVILAVTGLRSDVNGEHRRTSVEMIDRFYAKPLCGEMNIVMLHSKRRRRRGVTGVI